jgi:hypothetical protein
VTWKRFQPAFACGFFTVIDTGCIPLQIRAAWKGGAEYSEWLKQVGYLVSQQILKTRYNLFASSIVGSYDYAKSCADINNCQCLDDSKVSTYNIDLPMAN